MSVRTDGFFWDYLFGRRERTNAAAQQQQQRAQRMMAAENHERARSARHAEAQGYGVADLARLVAHLDAWPMDGGRPCDEARWRALVARRQELEALLRGAHRAPTERS